ncbi:hypothetical protein BZL41_00280 [Pseudomonas sp. PIC25]|uniref:STAS domain-containing protein n=1 Tax=Pseudomonas sp. PIC25 TaxID=1958773 RepID=UPI000BABB477|nr:STAS domain-containing protein [Pseudomonas sp. PIC25]PAU66692.1 hypothetical protein BZL41_00280 [Pseudomonas sp. PIC25]
MTRAQTRQLAVAGELTIYTASEWKPRLLAPLLEDEHLELDLGAVQELDTAGLQLLLLAKKEARARSLTLQFCNHSPAVLEAIELCGLAGFFGDPILLHPTRP